MGNCDYRKLPLIAVLAKNLTIPAGEQVHEVAEVVAEGDAERAQGAGGEGGQGGAAGQCGQVCLHSQVSSSKLQLP